MSDYQEQAQAEMVGPWDDPATPEVCPDCGTATMARHPDGSKTCGHCYMKRAYDLGVLTGRRPPEYR